MYPVDSISEQRLSLVHPQLSQKIEAMAAVLAENGVIIRVVQGLRTMEEQDELYAQGRTKPGNIVTNARGGDSMHNYGFAVDCVPGLPDHDVWTPDWNGRDSFYADMVAAGEAQGLVSGAHWHSIVDYPHFQLHGLPVSPSEQMRTDFLAGGLPLVWTKYESGVY